MKKSAERVRALVASGSISQKDGDALLASLDGGTPKSSDASRCVRFDGFIDLHIVATQPSLRASLIDQLASFVVPSLVAFAMARILRSQARLVDLVGSVGLSRAPYLGAGLVAAIVDVGTKGTHGVGYWLVLGAALAAVAWSLTLRFFGFRNATGIAGKRGTVAFIVFVLCSEIVSVALLGALVGRSSP